MEKIKKFRWNISRGVSLVSDAEFNANDFEVDKIALEVDNKYNGLMAVMLIKNANNETVLYQETVTEGIALFTLQNSEVVKGEYDVAFRLFEGDKVAESSIGHYKVVNGYTADNVVVSQNTLDNLSQLMVELKATINASEVAKGELDEAVMESVQVIATETEKRVEEIKTTQGMKGDKGDKGDTGEQGPQGIQGEQGKDIWDHEARIARLEVFMVGDTPNSKLIEVVGILNGNFGYWMKEVE